MPAVIQEQSNEQQILRTNNQHQWRCVALVPGRVKQGNTVREQDKRHEVPEDGNERLQKIRHIMSQQGIVDLRAAAEYVQSCDDDRQSARHQIPDIHTCISNFHTHPYGMSEMFERINTHAYGATMKPKSNLSPADWIMAGFRALTAGGPESVKVEAIARDLKVSKGSFYWHFKNAPALKSAMLAHWVERATQAIIDEVQAGENDARERLRLLARISTNDAETPYGGRMVEAAIRDWARFDPEVAKTIRIVDQKRLNFLETLFGALDPSPESCTIKANLTYAALIGLQHLSHHGLADLRRDLLNLLERLMADSQDKKGPDA